jgi:hypothetical protein
LSFPLSEQYRLVAKKWVDADSAASLLEETKSAILATMMTAFADEPLNRAEMKTKACPEWRDYIEKMVAQRKEANLLRAQLEYIRMQDREKSSAEATARAEMRL